MSAGRSAQGCGAAAADGRMTLTRSPEAAESLPRRCAAVSRPPCGSGGPSVCLEGSLMGQTVLLSQSTQWRGHTASPSLAAPAPPAPLDKGSSGNGNSGDGGQESRPDCTDAPSVTVSLVTSVNEGPSPWRRVQLVTLPPSSVVCGSPLPTIPAGAATTPCAQRAVRTEQNPAQTGAAPPLAMSNSQRNMEASASYGDRTPLREASPSRPQSSVLSVGDASRRLNFSGMSSSMSFRPPVASPCLADLPKGSPLVFDGSLKSTTPTRATPVAAAALQRPKPRPTTRGTPTAGSQFATTFCGRRSSFAPGSGLPLARGVMGGSGGGSLRAAAAKGHVFADPHDPAALARRQNPSVTPAPDTGVFQPWMPLGHEQEAPAAAAPAWVPLGQGMELLGQSRNEPAGAEGDDAGKKSPSPARFEATGLGFSGSAEGGPHATAMLEATVLEMRLQEGSISVSVPSPANTPALAEGEEHRHAKPPQEAREGAAEPGAERRRPSLRNRSPSQVNVEPHAVVKQDAPAAVSPAPAQPTEAPAPTRQA
ncbi:uncharacterized protein Tco025E_01109 [Trypanosoma conorhini]|uniref:Uncharacterized protein n=1 Tax=Trypanosoma conorhini TaxID=83891 RepID=A0A3R7NT67_9TRYP|nr:uncharacterized protein Tco025E_01109 [Trypanosoma conorhini]RNF26647.1 hypothetical protein Tco025E_01109 [Trypanosoma conorhini]